MREILRVDKPKGITSFDVIRYLKKKYNLKKVGHAGTLDPLASGLMIIGVGKGTKRLNEFLKLDKVYDVEILVGEKRATGDMEGEVVEQVDVKSLDEGIVEETLQSLVGTLSIPVPRYSAIKLGGERLYKKARRGEEVEVPVKEMTVYSVKFKKIEKLENRFVVFARMHVASGVYIRSVVEEFGERLGYPATTKNLRRTKIGKHTLFFAKRIKIGEG